MTVALDSSCRGWPALLLVAVLCFVAADGALAQPSFEHVVIDADNPQDPHCKTLGDIDGDGLLDAVVASDVNDGMFWYEYPGWDKHTIRAAGGWTTDMQAGDLDADGDLDIVIPNSSGLQWYENPGPTGDPRTDFWVEHLIGAAGSDHHDVEVADVDQDGDLDVVSRKKGGGATYLWRQGSNADDWTRVTISTLSGEGVGLGDIDGDGDLDVAQNGTWVEQVSATMWTAHTIDSESPHDVGVLVADIDGNGTQDVVIGPSESSSGHLSWYEAIEPVAGSWVRHTIDPTVSYLHTFKAADVDDDGDLDLVTAEMHQSADPDEVGVYYNHNQATSWTQQVVAASGSHNVRAGDIGGDGDIDIFGANWNDAAPNSAVVEAWTNESAPRSLDDWQRYILETSLPWRAVFVDGADINGDGLPDIVAGGWWYPNPGSLGGTWTRQAIGAGLENVAAVHDFDRDGDLDILGTNGNHVGNDLAWAENDGSGSFNVRDITTTSGGDFLQGVSVYEILPGGQEEVVLSWHNGVGGTSILSVPEDPTMANWPKTTVATTNMEEVPVGDIDDDGDVDIHLGDAWLRQESNGTFSIQDGVDIVGDPDRIKLADLDGDGDLDVVIGVEFADHLLWGENDGSGGGWTKRTIATDFDYFSVDVADFDNDGDIDVVGGAHMGNGEVSIYANNGSGTAWTTHVVDSGHAQIDHHDGTQVVDLDLDGDLDIVSIGWSKQSLVVYENLSTDGGGGGGDSTPPRIAAVNALGVGTPVVVDFSEALNPATAGKASNYSIAPGESVNAAQLSANQRSVLLDASTLATGVEYTLAVDNVTDLAGNAIAAGTEVAFEVGVGEPLADLVAHWPLAATSGSVAVDVSGNGHHGVLVNGVGWGGSASFDGVDDYIDAGSFDVGGAALTVAAWIWSDDLDNCSSNDCRILSKATGTAEADHTFMLSTISGGASSRLRFRLKTGGTTSTLIADSGDLAENTWYHAAAVYDGAEMRLYLDGIEVGGMAKSGSITAAPAVPVWIGGNPGGASEKPWDGLIDDVRIYSRALSPAELQSLPPPGQDWIFGDGFENGLPRWSGHAGPVVPLASAAWSGLRGARIQAGTSCSGPDQLTVGPPGANVSGSFQACQVVDVEGVHVETPGANFRAGESVTFDSGFTAGADFSVQIDPTLVPFHWLREASPSSETAYTADFRVNLDNLDLGAGDRLEHFVARSSGQSTLSLTLQPDGSGGEEAAIQARLDNGSVVTTPSGHEAPIPPGWHNLRLVWTSGAGDGSLRLFIDGVEVLSFANLVNGDRRVDTVFWGVVAGEVDGTAGTIDVDAFGSW